MDASKVVYLENMDADANCLEVSRSRYSWRTDLDMGSEISMTDQTMFARQDNVRVEIDNLETDGG